MTAIPLSLLYGAFIAALLVAMLIDVISLEIPNWISVTIIALFPALALGTSDEAGSGGWWVSHLGAGLLVFAIGFGLFAWGKIGGGDVKLLAAVSLWFGLGALPALMIAIGIINGAVSLAYLAMRHLGADVALQAHGITLASLQHGRGIPYALSIAAGSILLLVTMPAGGL